MSPTSPNMLAAPRNSLESVDATDSEALDLSEFEAEFAPRARGRPRRTLRLLVVGFGAFLLLGNAVILAASLWARHTTAGAPIEVPADVAGIHNFKAVDDGLWRGGAPTDAEYRALGDAGVTTVIDLRAEHDLEIPFDVIDEAGLKLVRIPIRDGQAPRDDQVARFLDAVAASPGRVYLHCGAGVGRTGTMVAVYRAAQGGSGWEAVRDNLAVGPPSLEQLAFAKTGERPSTAVVALSRTLDGPRRLWKVFEGL